MSHMGHGKLLWMSSRRPLHVTLTGDLSGDYVVVEERSDGSLLVAPDTSKRRDGAARRPAPDVGGTLLSGLLTRSKQATTSVPETLKAWGVELDEQELVRDFLLAEIDGRRGLPILREDSPGMVARPDRAAEPPPR
jgi:hypothetical protein